MFNLNGIYGYSRFGKILATIIQVVGYGIGISVLGSIWYEFFFKETMSELWQPTVLTIIALVAFQIFSIILVLAWRIFELVAWLGATEQHRWEVISKRRCKREENKPVEINKAYIEAQVRDIYQQRALRGLPLPRINNSSVSGPVRYYTNDREDIISASTDEDEIDIDKEYEKLLEYEFELPY